jgi:hypothetical protein
MKTVIELWPDQNAAAARISVLQNAPTPPQNPRAIMLSEVRIHDRRDANGCAILLNNTAGQLFVVQYEM